MAEISAKALAAYIQKKYLIDKGKELSPIKLQKSLYFLFAYWGGTVKKAKLYPEIIEDKAFINFNEYLFDETIEAWVYGPVVPDVYHTENISDFFNKNLFKGKDKLNEFVDGLLKDIFEVSDFTLVEISHNDECWKNKFYCEEPFHNNIIDKEDIINEYARK